ncbi:cell wall-active antibiotics response domain protein [Streptococcus oralis]|nr:cell wall-active antibiotics response domain protein [Streptococcus oralis]
MYLFVNRFFHPQTEVTFLNCDKIEREDAAMKNFKSFYLLKPVC